MTLIDQLRNIARQPQGPTYKALHELCAEAADEIERLQIDYANMMASRNKLWNENAGLKRAAHQED